MKNMSPQVMLILGIVLFIIGGGLYWQSSAPNISADDQARCEQLVQKKYGENSSSIIASCKTDVGFIAMMDSQANGVTSAEDAAKAISSANNKEVGTSTLGKFLMGLCFGIGISFIFKGIAGIRNKSISG